MKKHGWISWLLLAGMLLCTWGCSDNTAAEDAVSTDEQNTEAAEESVDLSLRENTPDSLPQDLDFGGTAVRVSNRGQYDYIDYEMPVEEPSGDIVEDALYARDRSVEERLNVDIVYSGCDVQNDRHGTAAIDDACLNGYKTEKWIGVHRCSDLFSKRTCRCSKL